MTNLPTRLLQESLRLEQISIGKETNPDMLVVRERYIRYLANELLHRWREESARLTLCNR
jgi:hypothetical protein